MKADTAFTLQYPDGARATNVKVASSVKARFVGLLFRKSMPDDEALFFPDVNHIHTYYMQMPIDVLFLAGEIGGPLEVVDAFQNVAPNRTLRSRSADHCLELAAGAIARFGAIPQHISLIESRQ